MRMCLPGALIMIAAGIVYAAAGTGGGDGMLHGVAAAAVRAHPGHDGAARPEVDPACVDSVLSR